MRPVCCLPALLVLALAVNASRAEDPLEEPPGDLLDFDWGWGGVPMLPGIDVGAARPWSPFLTLAAINADSAGPHRATLVDEDAWTEGAGGPFGGGWGVPPRRRYGGKHGAGMLLAIADDDTDVDGDGRFDRPASAVEGGTLVLNFPGPTRCWWLTLFDVDEPGGKIRGYDPSGVLYAEYDLNVSSGDQELSFQSVPGGLLSRIEIDFAGTGAVVDATMIGCPAILAFDETTTGVPLGKLPGEEVGGSYSDIGLFDGFVTAVNNDPTHPQRAILFDSANPTGDDPDLVTPGTGSGNVLPERKVLVIAENEVDADMDGIVDDPDAEPAGGIIRFTWVTSDVYFKSMTVLDVDDAAASFVRVYDGQGPDYVDLPIASLDDNSIQIVSASLTTTTRRIEAHFGGDAAVVELRVCSDD